MSLGRRCKTEHAGARDRGRKGGYWGTRIELKTTVSKTRRRRGKDEVRRQLDEC